RAAVGQTVAVKSVIAVIDTEAAAGAVAPKAEAAAPAPVASAPQPAAAAPASAATPVATPPVAAAPLKSAPTKKTSLKSPLADEISENGVGLAEISRSVPAQVGDRFYSPLVRNLAAREGLSPNELATIPGSGAHGRLTKEDVITYLQFRSSTPSPVPPAAAGSAKQKEPAAPKLDYNSEGIRVEPMDNMRKRIAEHMVRSKATSPHVYTVAEVDLSRVARWREVNQKAFLGREGFKLSFTPFFLEAAVRALVQYPHVNGSVEGETHILKKQVNLGCAVALGNGGTGGLIVPVIKGADQLTLVGIARQLNELAGKARTKKLVPDEISGGTFTVTNPGVFGSILGYPIINQPQLAIMGVGAIKKRAVVVDDMIAIREMVYLTLSYDHRVIDGSLGGQFLNYIAKYLENWDSERPLA
ncbi:MAG: 2-oxo acid dehydrogenase subunit E2, partial [Deltaproteobacteria bacterium]|nr:2-oxo acid dehydrogenase subunit E2 [Deltaproteobacteria bacterium]